ncbi:unnamed protein product, partial [Didymodactylos carnosus]
NYEPILKGVGFEVREYRYWNNKTFNIDFDGLLEDLEDAPAKSDILLHGCAHNPTGCDPTKEQWRQIAETIQRKHLFPFFDLAYQDEDAWSVRYFADTLNLELFVAHSFSKNLGVYSQRVGQLIACFHSADTVPIFLSQIALVVCRNYLTPPEHGAQIVSTVFNTEDLYREWILHVKRMYSRIQAIRQKLYNQLTELGTPDQIAVKVVILRPANWRNISRSLDGGITGNLCDKRIQDFHGTKQEDVVAWIDQLEVALDLTDHAQGKWSKLAAWYLKGVALSWYIKNKNQVYDWDSFRQMIVEKYPTCVNHHNDLIKLEQAIPSSTTILNTKSVSTIDLSNNLPIVIYQLLSHRFPVIPPSNDREILRQLAGRKQAWNEPISRFYRDIMNLCDKYDSSMADSSRIDYSQGGLKPELQHYALNQQITTPEQFFDITQQHEHIQVRLSNVQLNDLGTTAIIQETSPRKGVQQSNTTSVDRSQQQQQSAHTSPSTNNCPQNSNSNNQQYINFNTCPRYHDQQQLHHAPITRKSYYYQLANKTNMHFIGEVQLKVRIKYITTWVTALVADSLCIDFILGNDWIRQYQDTENVAFDIKFLRPVILGPRQECEIEAQVPISTADTVIFHPKQ